MVFVMWDERYQAFVKKYQSVSFRTIGQALEEKSGWNGIAGRSEWGLFKFGHTHPNQSNSGLMTLVLMAFDYHRKCRDLEMKDILDEGFQDWMRGIERGVTGLVQQHRQHDARHGAQGTVVVRRAVRLRERGRRLPQERRGPLGTVAHHLSRSEHVERQSVLRARCAVEQQASSGAPRGSSSIS